MKESIVEEAMKVRGVRGAALLADPGKVAKSNVDAKELHEFFESMYRVATDGKSATAIGAVRRLVVRTDKEEDLLLVLQNKQGLAVVAERSRPQKELFAEVDELVKKG